MMEWEPGRQDGKATTASVQVSRLDSSALAQTCQEKDTTAMSILDLGRGEDARGDNTRGDRLLEVTYAFGNDLFPLTVSSISIGAIRSVPSDGRR